MPKIDNCDINFAHTFIEKIYSYKNMIGVKSTIFDLKKHNNIHLLNNMNFIVL